MTEATIIPTPVEPAARERRLVHIRELDGIRGIAALMVFFHHLCYTSVETPGWGISVRLLHALSKFGSAGVDVFFVLSGFLITSLLIDDRGNPSYYHDFYWKRALRILPLYLICLIGILIFVPGIGPFVLLCLFFISNFAPLLHVTANGPFWTLAIEEQFYLLWPTVVRRRSIQQLTRWALAVLIVPSVLRFAAATTGHHDFAFTFFHCDGLAMGAFLACRYESRHQDAPGRIRAGLLALGVAAAVFLTISQLLPESRFGEAFAAAFLNTGLTLLAGALVGSLIANAGAPSLNCLRSGALPFFGLISYALYMIHTYVLEGYDHFRGPLQTGNLPAYYLRFFAILSTTIVLCLISRHLIELPATRLRRYVLKRPAPHAIRSTPHVMEQPVSKS